MFFANVNLVTVLIASIVSMAIGFIWYSPWLFGKKFISLMSYSAEESAKKTKDMWKSYLITFLGSLVTAYVLAVIINSLFVSGIYGLLIVGLVVSIGLIAPVKLNDVTFGHDSWTLFLITSACQVISMVVMSIIIGLFS